MPCTQIGIVFSIAKVSSAAYESTSWNCNSFFQIYSKLGLKLFGRKSYHLGYLWQLTSMLSWAMPLDQVLLASFWASQSQKFRAFKTLWFSALEYASGLCATCQALEQSIWSMYILSWRYPVLAMLGPSHIPNLRSVSDILSPVEIDSMLDTTIQMPLNQQPENPQPWRTKFRLIQGTTTGLPPKDISWFSSASSSTSRTDMFLRHHVLWRVGNARRSQRWQNWKSQRTVNQA